MNYLIYVNFDFNFNLTLYYTIQKFIFKNYTQLNLLISIYLLFSLIIKKNYLYIIFFMIV